MPQFYGGVNRRTVDAVTSRPYGAPSGRAWFVDATSGSDSAAGSAEAPFLTVAAAISASTASVGDVIIIAPGTYTITAALVPKAGTAFLAGVVLNPATPTVIITGNIADLIQIDVANTRWENIEFKASGATADNLVDVADGAAVDGVSFFQCVFNGNDQTSVIGINANDATFAVTRMHVEECLFRDLTGTMVNIGVLGMAYSRIKRNVFACDINSGVSIALADTTAFATGKAYIIEENFFLPFDVTANEVAISIAGTEDTTGVGIITNNRFSYYPAATAVTIDKVGASEVQNFTAAATGGGTVVTTGT